MAIALVGLGSNLAHPRRQIAWAAHALARLPRTSLVALSPNYATAPLGGEPGQPDYVNAVAMLRTALAPRALLSRLLAIERRRGRIRVPGTRNAARTLDLDLLTFDGRRIETCALTLPHPRMHERAFVLRPLADVAPTLAVPGRGSVQLLARRVHGQRVRRTRRARPPR